MRKGGNVKDKCYLKLAAVTPQTKVGDIIHNIKACADAAELASNADIIVMPELALTGATANELFLDDFFVITAERATRMLAERTQHIKAVIVVGGVVIKDDYVYNAGIVLRAGRVLGHVCKQCLTQTEARWFTPGYEVKQEGRLGVTFASDPRIYTPIVAMLDARPFILGEDANLDNFIYRYTTADLVYSSAGAHESSESATYAGIKFFAQNGAIVKQSKPFGPALFTKHDGVSAPQPLSYDDPACPFVPTQIERATKSILDIQAHGLAERLTHINAKTITLGLSGGLDSTLALLAACRATELLGWQHSAIHTVSMPSRATSERTRTNADKLASVFQTTYTEIPIYTAISQHLTDIKHDRKTFDVVYENAQARERTQILFDLANQEDGIVLGTGDMSELALGFATYNGDLSCNYGVNANVPKTLIQAVINQIAENTENAMLKTTLSSIALTPISPELIPGQRTEDILGPYLVHDYYLYHFLHTHPDPRELLQAAEQIFAQTFTAQQLKMWLRTFYHRFFASQFKRNVCADSPQILDVTIVGPNAYCPPADTSSYLWEQALS